MPHSRQSGLHSESALESGLERRGGLGSVTGSEVGYLGPQSGGIKTKRGCGVGGKKRVISPAPKCREIHLDAYGKRLQNKPSEKAGTHRTPHALEEESDMVKEHMDTHQQRPGPDPVVALETQR